MDHGTAGMDHGQSTVRHPLRRALHQSTGLISEQAPYTEILIVPVNGRWCYLYRAIDRSGALIDVLFSEHRDMKAARAFFRSAKAVTGLIPDRVTPDGHDSYKRAVRTELSRGVRHRTSRYLNNRIEQDHRGIKGDTG